MSNPETRENALLELSKKRESVPDLAPMLWHSFGELQQWFSLCNSFFPQISTCFPSTLPLNCYFSICSFISTDYFVAYVLGTIAALLQEIINIYPSITPPTLTAQQSNRVCNALALLQNVASHPETRSMFLSAHTPLFLYPFLHTSSKTRPFEYLRLTSLGVIGALVKTDEQEVITFLLTTEIIPLCLRIMESGSELSKTVATFILQKILLDDSGLSYICQTYDRFSHVAIILVSSPPSWLFSQLFNALSILGQNGDIIGKRTVVTSPQACCALLSSSVGQRSSPRSLTTLLTRPATRHHVQSVLAGRSLHQTLVESVDQESRDRQQRVDPDFAFGMIILM